MPLDLTLMPIYRINRQDQASLPGLMATVPPHKTARGRDQDRLIVYLLLTGNAVFPTGEYVQLASRAAVAFYETPGALTSALRASAESINKPLLERNMSTSGRGQYAVGLLVLAAVRDAQVTLLLSGPIHAFLLGANGAQHIFDTLSGKGLGLSQSSPYYFSQLTLQPNDRLLFCGKVPPAWESALNDPSPASLDSTRRRLMTLTTEDLNAALLYAASGVGILTVMRPIMEPHVDDRPTPVSSESQNASLQKSDVIPEPDQITSAPAAHMLQPSAYAIPPEPKEELPSSGEDSLSAADLYSSLPRAKNFAETSIPEEQPEILPEPQPSAPRPPSEGTRRAAKRIVSGMQALRQGNERLSQGLQNFLPRLLPGSEGSSLSIPSSAMVFISLLIPLIVVTIASVVYFRYGRSVQYEQYLIQAQDARAQALSVSDPAAQREAWQRELFYLDKADFGGPTSETGTLRSEAQSNLDKLEGISRLQFQPVLSTGVGAQISRIAASENDLYLLDAQRGSILHVALTSGGFQLDTAFNCVPGVYGTYTVGPLVDILAMPTVNTINATVIGVDASGNLLYCAPGQVAQAIPLPPPDTNWGRVTAFTLDAGNLYVMDAPSRAIWVYVGRDGTFVDRPYFFFGGQIPTLEDAIDLAVSGDDLYILHSDGHLSNCSYSRIEAVPTRCVDPVALINPFPAYRDVNIFGEVHFTQMMFMPAPDSNLLILDSDSQGVFRFTARSLELQNQLRPLAGRDNPLPRGAVGAMTVSPNHVLYFAVQDKIYFAVDSP
ncbi:MAG TPA: hypothetical protein VHM28_00295 [Anaerolineales bacterium]|nr:hypothetical protein [Anaerolineales bacterium]